MNSEFYGNLLFFLLDCFLSAVSIAINGYFFPNGGAEVAFGVILGVWFGCRNPENKIFSFTQWSDHLKNKRQKLGE